MSRAGIFLLVAAAVFCCQGCGEITGPSFAHIASPRAIVNTPSSPATGIITVRFQVIDRERELADVTLEYSTDGGQTFYPAALTDTAEATSLTSDWYPGITHALHWRSVDDMVGRSGAVDVCLKVTPSDATNPSGTAGVSGIFTVDNLAFNEDPGASVDTPLGVQYGNVQVTYDLTDAEGDPCTIQVEYSDDNGVNWYPATEGPAGDGTTGLSSSPGGEPHVFLWNCRADGVAPSSLENDIKVRVTPTDFDEGGVGATDAFTVNNTIANIPPAVTILTGPAQDSTVFTDQVTFTWSGNDSDGLVVKYYYSFDQDPPDIETTDTSVTSSILSEGSHSFRVAAVDDENALSAVASRTFTISVSGTIEAGFTASPVSGTAPLTVYFTDSSVGNITSWSWDFGDGGTTTSQNPSHTYSFAGLFTVTLTVAGPNGTDTKTRTDHITVYSPGAVSADEIEVFDLVNDERRLVSRSELLWCDGLASHAWCHAHDMCERGFFSHVNPEGEDPSKRAQRAHAGSFTFADAPYGLSQAIVPDPYPWIGENIAWGQATPAAVMDAWMHSPGHRANILDSRYSHIGVGVCDCSTRHWCQNFGYR